MQFDTYDMPTTINGLFNMPGDGITAVYQAALPLATEPLGSSNKIIATISEKEGDFDPIQAPGCYWTSSSFRRGEIPSLGFYGQDHFWYSNWGGLRTLMLEKDRIYYLNMVGTTSPADTPPARIRPQTRQVPSYAHFYNLGGGSLNQAYSLDNSPPLTFLEGQRIKGIAAKARIARQL